MTTTTATKIAATATVDTTSVKSADPVVTAYEKDTSLVEKLKSVQVALAHEYARLRWLEENPSQMDDLLEAGRSASRRVRALKRLTEIELKEHRLRGHEPQIDLHDPLVKEVIALLVDTLADVTRDIIAEDDADKIFETFKSTIQADANIPWP